MCLQATSALYCTVYNQLLGRACNVQELMQKVADDPHCLRVAAFPGLLATLSRYNAALEV
jgi:hypothetical protein